MADETTAVAPTAEQAGDATTTPVAVDANGGGEQPVAQVAKTFTQDEVNALIDERLKRERETAKKKADRDKIDAEANVMKEQGKYQELYEAEKARADKADADRSALEISGWRRDAAAKYKLPVGFADRLTGETAEELGKDAQALAAMLPRPAAPNTNDQGNGTPKGSAMSDAELTHLSGVLGLPKKYLEQAGG